MRREHRYIHVDSTSDWMGMSTIRVYMLVSPMQFPAGISIDLLVWLSCRVSYINNNTISGLYLQGI